MDKCLWLTFWAIPVCSRMTAATRYTTP